MTLSYALKDQMIDRARQAALSAYAPYSRYHVGSAILTASDQIYVGCNVENAAYGLCSCAERNAIFRAISEEGPTLRLQALVVVNREETACTPCGGCRQIIAEFGPTCIITYTNGTAWLDVPLTTLLPEGFHLSQSRSTTSSAG